MERDVICRVFLAKLGDVLAVVLLRVVHEHVHALLGVLELRYEREEEVEELRGLFDVQRHEHDRPRVALQRDCRDLAKSDFVCYKKAALHYSHIFGQRNHVLGAMQTSCFWSPRVDEVVGQTVELCLQHNHRCQAL